MSQQEFINYISRFSFSHYKWRAYEQIKIIVGPIAQDYKEYEKMMEWAIEWLGV